MSFSGQKLNEPQIFFCECIRLFGIGYPRRINNGEIGTHMIHQPDITFIENINIQEQLPPIFSLILIPLCRWHFLQTRHP